MQRLQFEHKRPSQPKLIGMKPVISRDSAAQQLVHGLLNEEIQFRELSPDGIDRLVEHASALFKCLEHFARKRWQVVWQMQSELLHQQLGRSVAGSACKRGSGRWRVTNMMPAHTTNGVQQRESKNQLRPPGAVALSVHSSPACGAN